MSRSSPPPPPRDSGITKKNYYISHTTQIFFDYNYIRCWTNDQLVSSITTELSMSTNIIFATMIFGLLTLLSLKLKPWSVIRLTSVLLLHLLHFKSTGQNAPHSNLQGSFCKSEGLVQWLTIFHTVSNNDLSMCVTYSQSMVIF